MQPTSPIPVIIMAGGKGSRIGGNKAFRILGGERLLAHVLAKAKGYSGDIAVAIAEGACVDLSESMPLLVDEADQFGPIAGLLSAFKYGAAAASEHVLVIPCDTPFLPDNLLASLSNAIGTAGVAIPRSGDKLQAACGLWRTDAARFLPKYLQQGRRSLVGFAESVGHVMVDWPAEPHDPFFNINTAQDLAEADLILRNLPPTP